MNSTRTATRARRAVIAGGGSTTTREAMSWIWPGRTTFTRTHYRLAARALRAFCAVEGYQRRGRNSRSPGGFVWVATGPIEHVRPQRLTGTLWWQGDAVSAELQGKSTS
jgi:hypothetical protein